MADFALALDPAEGAADLVTDETLVLAEDDGLESAVIVSLGTHETADAEDTLPDPADPDRRGWWGDHDGAEIWGDDTATGAKFWLMERDAIRPASPGRIEAYARDSLAWLLDMRIATAIDVTVTRVREGFETRIVVKRDERVAVDLRFDSLWNALRA